MLKAEDLAAFDESAKCTKCGCVDIQTKFYNRSQQYPVEVQRDVLKGKRVSFLYENYLCFRFEFLLRTCTRCNFKWAERPLDVKLESGT